MARKYHVPHYDYEDLCQELRIVLIKAAKHYDPTKTASFHTYFHRSIIMCIGGLLHREIKRNFNFIDIDLIYSIPGQHDTELDIDYYIENFGLSFNSKRVLRLLLYGYSKSEVKKEIGNFEMINSLNEIKERFEFLLHD